MRGFARCAWKAGLVAGGKKFALARVAAQNPRKWADYVQEKLTYTILCLAIDKTTISSIMITHIENEIPASEGGNAL